MNDKTPAGLKKKVSSIISQTVYNVLLARTIALSADREETESREKMLWTFWLQGDNLQS
jgi:hypothetical protein